MYKTSKAIQRMCVLAGISALASLASALPAQDAKINIDLINTSEVRVNVIVDGKQGQKAAAQLQAAFADVMR